MYERQGLQKLGRDWQQVNEQRENLVWRDPISRT